MENPIGYGSLFNEGDIRSGLERLVGEIVKARGEIEEQLKGIKTSAGDAFGALSGTSSSTKGGQDSIKNYSAQIEELTTLYNQQKAELDKLTDALEKLNKKRASAPNTASQTKLEVEAFKKLTNEERQVYLVARQLVTTKKELAAIERDVVKVAREQEGSYNRLAATYNLATAALKAMTDEQRMNTEQGKMLTKIAADSMAQMKALSAQYGKHTLDVGNYAKAVEGLSEKAMNGLFISTQQILREMPTLANSASQFFVAISNNVPIFVDAFKRAREETGSFKTALMATLRSIKSGQTLLLVVLTVLPKLAKAIHNKRKAQEEDNKAMEDAVKYAEILKKAYQDIDKAVVQNTSSLRTYYAISTDFERSMQDRIKAGEILKEQYKDAFANYTAEEIALGKAKVAYDELTKTLVIQAKQRAYLNKITALQEQIIDQTAVRDQAKAELEAAKAMEERRQREMDAYAKASEKMIGAGGQEFAAFSDRLAKAQKEVEKASATFMKADMPLQDIDNAILKLTKDMPVDGILPELLTGRGRKGKDVSMKDYFVTFYKGILEQIEGDRSREELLAMFEFDTQIDKYKKYLAEQRALSKEEREIDVQQELYIEGIILNLEEQKYVKLAEIDEKWTKKINDANLKQQKAFEKEQEQAFKDELANAQLILDTENNLDRERYENNVLYRRAAIDNEIEYWGNYLDTIIKYGKWTEEEEKNVLANIARLREQRARTLPKSLWDLLGMATNEEVPREYRQTIEQAFNYAFNYMDTWMDKRLEMAEIELEAAKRQADIVKTYLDIEQEARANGYANNVEMARRAYEKQLELQRKAAAEAERIARIQNALNTATQASELLTATAKIWSAEGIKGILGVPLATAATASMWASFIASKAMASKVTAKTYGEGGYEYMNYGGSHASGHDIDFGRTRDGRARRVERGEMVGIINKKNVAKYGVGTIGGIIDSINNGTFEMADKYSLAFQGSNLTTLENGVNALVEQGKEKIVATPWGRIEYSGNVKRIIKN